MSEQMLQAPKVEAQNSLLKVVEHANASGADDLGVYKLGEGDKLTSDFSHGQGDLERTTNYSTAVTPGSIQTERNRIEWGEGMRNPGDYIKFGRTATTMAAETPGKTFGINASVTYHKELASPDTHFSEVEVGHKHADGTYTSTNLTGQNAIKAQSIIEARIKRNLTGGLDIRDKLEKSA